MYSTNLVVGYDIGLYLQDIVTLMKTRNGVVIYNILILHPQVILQ
jgi:hypothetical protein